MNNQATVNINANTDKFTKGLEAVKKTVADFTSKVLKGFNEAFNNTNKTVTRTSTVLNEANKNVKNLKNETLKTNEAFGKLVASSGKLFAVLNVLGNVEPIARGFKIVKNEISGVITSLTRTNEAIMLMNSNGVSTQVIDEFKLLQDAMLGNSEALNTFSMSAIARFNEFEANLTSVRTLLKDFTDEEITNYGKSITDLVNGPLKNAVTSNQALAGAYEAVSAGFAGAIDSQRVMTAGLKLATTGAADSGETLRLLAKTMNAYGISSKDAGKTAAILNGIVEKGITTINELSLGFGEAATTAKAASIKLHELGAATAVLTTKGSSTPSALTGISSLASIIIDKTPEAAKALKELRDESGKSIKFDKAEIEAKGLTKAIQDLNKAVGGNAQKLAEIIPESRAYSTFLALAANNSKELAEITVDLGKVTADNLEQVFGIKLNNSKAKFEQVVNRFGEVMIEFGRAIAPAFEASLESINYLSQVLLDITPTVSSFFGTFVTAIKPIQQIASVVGHLTKMFLGLLGVYMSIRLTNLAFGLLTGNKELFRQVGLVRDLIKEKKGWLNVGKQILGIDQSHLLVLKNSNTELVSNAERLKDVVSQNVRVKAAQDKLNDTFDKYEKLVSKRQTLENKSNNAIENIKRLAEEREKLNYVINNGTEEEKKAAIESIKLAEQKAEANQKVLEGLEVQKKHTEDEIKLISKKANIQAKDLSDKTKAVTAQELDRATKIAQLEEMQAVATKLKNEAKEADITLSAIKLKQGATATEIQEAETVATNLNTAAVKAQQQATSIKIALDKTELTLQREQLVAEGQLIKTKVFGNTVYLQSNVITRLLTKSLKDIKTETILFTTTKYNEIKAWAISTATKLKDIAVDKASIITKKIAILLDKERTVITYQNIKAKLQELTTEKLLNAQRILSQSYQAGLAAKSAAAAKGASGLAQNTAFLTGSTKALGTALTGAAATMTAMVASLAILAAGVIYLASDGFEPTTKAVKEFRKLTDEHTGAFKEYSTAINNINDDYKKMNSQMKVTVASTNRFEQAVQGLWNLTKAAWRSIFSGLYQGAFNKDMRESAAVVDNLQNAILEIIPVNKQLAQGMLFTSESNDKIRRGIQLSIDDFEREQAIFKKRSEAMDALISKNEEAIKSLVELYNKEDDEERKEGYKNRIALMQAQIDKIREEREELEKNYQAAKKLTEFRNQYLAKQNLYDNTSIADTKKAITDNKQIIETANKGIQDEMAKTGNIIDSSLKKNVKSFVSDYQTGTLSVKNSLKTLGVDVNKFNQEELASFKIAIEKTNLEKKGMFGRTELEGKRLEELTKQGVKNLKDLLNSKEIKEKFQTLGIDLSKLSNKQKENLVKVFNDTEKGLSNLSSEKLKGLAQEIGIAEESLIKARNKFKTTLAEDVGKNSIETALKKSLRNAENEVSNTAIKIENSLKGINTFTDTNVSKFIDKAAKEGIQDLEKELQKLGISIEELKPEQLEKFKAALTGKNEQDIKKALKEIGVAIDENINPDDIDPQKFETSVQNFIEALDNAYSQGFVTAEEASKRYNETLDKLKGKLKPEQYIELINKGLEYEKDASEQKIKIYENQANSFETIENSKLISGLAINKKLQDLQLKQLKSQQDFIDIQLKKYKEAGLENSKQYKDLQQQQKQLELEDFVQRQKNYQDNLDAELDILTDNNEKKSLEIEQAVYKEGKLKKDAIKEQNQIAQEDLKNELNNLNKKIDLQKSNQQEIINRAVAAGLTLEEAQQSYQTALNKLELEASKKRVDIVKAEVNEKKRLLDEKANEIEDKLNKTSAQLDKDIEEGTIKEKEATIKSIENKANELKEKETLIKESIQLAKDSGESTIKLEAELLRNQTEQRKTANELVLNDIEWRNKEIKNKLDDENRAIEESVEQGKKTREQADKEIFNNKQEQLNAEIKDLEARKELQSKSGKDLTDIENQIADKKLQIQKNSNSEIERLLNERINKSKQLTNKDILSTELRVKDEEKAKVLVNKIRQDELKEQAKNLELQIELYKKTGRNILDLQIQQLENQKQQRELAFNSLIEEIDKQSKQLDNQIADSNRNRELAVATGNKTEIQAEKELTKSKINEIDKREKLLLQQIETYKQYGKRTVELENQVQDARLEKVKLANEQILKDLDNQNNKFRNLYNKQISNQELATVKSGQLEEITAKKITNIKIEQLQKEEPIIKQRIEAYRKQGKDVTELENQLLTNRIESFKLSNEQILKDIDNSYNKIKSLREKQATNEEIKSASGLKSEIETNKEISKIKIQSLEDDTRVNEQRIEEYKKQGKSIVELEKQIQNNKLESLRITNEEILKSIDIQSEKYKNNTDKQIKNEELASLTRGQLEETTTDNILSFRIEASKKDELIIKQRIEAYKKQGKNIEALEIQLQENQIDRLKINNEKIINNIENTAKRIKTIRSKELLNSEIDNLFGKSNEEEAYKKSIVIRNNSLKDEEKAIKSRIEIYKKQGKNIGDLEIELLNNTKSKRELYIESETKSIDLLSKKLQNSVANRNIEVEKQVELGNKKEFAASQESIKNKQLELIERNKLIQQQIELYQKSGKDTKELYTQINQNELDIIKQSNQAKLNAFEEEVKIIDRSNKKKQIALSIDRTNGLNVDIFKKEQYKLQETELSIQEDTIKKRIILYRSMGKDIGELENQLLELDKQRADIRLSKTIDTLEKQKEVTNLYYDSQKQELENQRNNLDFFTKDLDEQNKRIELRNRINQANNDLAISQLDLQLRTTKDVELRAKLEKEKAQITFKAAEDNRKIEIESLEMQHRSNEAASNREKIELRMSKLETQKQRANLQIELVKAKREGRSNEEIKLLEFQLRNTSQQLVLLDRQSSSLNNRIILEKESLEAQSKELEIKQSIARQGGLLDIELAKQNEIIAGYDKKIQLLQLEQQELEVTSQNQTIYLDQSLNSLNKQNELLQQKQQILGDIKGLYENEINVVIGSSKTEFRQRALREQMEKSKLAMLREEQKIERELFELGLKQKEIDIERLEVQAKANKEKAKAELAIKEAERAKVYADKNSTDLDKRAADAAVRGSQASLQAANYEGYSVSVQREQLSKSIGLQRFAFNRKQDNAMFNQRVAIAQSTFNQADDRILGDEALNRSQRSLRDFQQVANTFDTKVKSFTDYLKDNSLEYPSKQKEVKKEDSKKNEKIVRDVKVEAPINIKIELNREEASDSNSAQKTAQALNKELKNIINITKRYANGNI